MSYLNRAEKKLERRKTIDTKLENNLTNWKDPGTSLMQQEVAQKNQNKQDHAQVANDYFHKFIYNKHRTTNH